MAGERGRRAASLTGSMCTSEPALLGSISYAVKGRARAGRRCPPRARRPRAKLPRQQHSGAPPLGGVPRTRATHRHEMCGAPPLEGRSAGDARRARRRRWVAKEVRGHSLRRTSRWFPPGWGRMLRGRSRAGRGGGRSARRGWARAGGGWHVAQVAREAVRPAIRVRRAIAAASRLPPLCRRLRRR